MAIFQSLKENWEHYSEQFKILIFGENNSRLDRTINRFYSMREEKRARVKLLSIIGVIILGTCILIWYFYGLYRSQTALNEATSAYVKIEEFKPKFMRVQGEYLKLSSNLGSVNQVENLIGAIDTAANRVNLSIQHVSSTPSIINLPSTFVTSKDFKKAKVDIQISNVSVKRLIDFLNEVHKLPNKFVLTKLEIIQGTEDKLYFNVNASFEAYIPVRGSRG